MSWREPGVRVRVTRLGWQFAFIGLCAMLGGAVRAYNLPLVLAGLIVGALILQWRWGRLTIAALTVQRRLPSEVFAGQIFPVRFAVTNHARWLPAWLVRIDDAIQLSQKQDGAGERIKRSSVEVEHAVKASCGLGVIPVGRTLTAHYDCTILRRGRYDLGPVKLSSGIPMGLMIASRINRQKDSLYVFPKLAPLKRHWRKSLQSRIGGSATNARRSGVHEGEFFGIRSWQAGDSRRWIHWRTTARIGEPAVRQFEQQRRFELCILVDAYLPTAGSRSSATPIDDAASDEAALERVISAAAGLVATLVATPTSKVGLLLAGRKIVAMSGSGGREQTLAMLRHLAELSGSPSPDLIGAVRQLIRTTGLPQDLLVISPRISVEESRDLVSMLSRRSVWNWFSVADGSINQLVERFPDDAATVESIKPAATDQLATDRPATDGPVTDGPVTDGPVTDRPVTDRPASSGDGDADRAVGDA